MTERLWWEDVGVKERKESGRNLRFSFCAALAAWSRDISSRWELSQKNKHGLGAGGGKQEPALDLVVRVAFSRQLEIQVWSSCKRLMLKMCN